MSDSNMGSASRHTWLRRVRSFVRREGRITEGQRKALDDMWPQFGVEYQDQLLDLDQLFGRTATRIVEIGFGMGTSLAEMAARHPDQDYLGIEVFRPGVGSLLRQVNVGGLNNIRVVSEDAVMVLEKMIPDASLDRVMLFFPDPWPKRRHHKRRIVQPSFLALLGKKLKVGGVIHMATDWHEYAKYMMVVLNDDAGFKNCLGDKQGDEGFSPRPDYRPLTKFELRGQKLGHGVWDLMFEKV